MMYWSLEELNKRLNEIVTAETGKKRSRLYTVFIMLPDSEAWNAIVPQLRQHCVNELYLSELCSNKRIPTVSHICARLKNCIGNTMSAAAGEIIRRRLYPILVDQLCRKNIKEGILFVPLLACSEEFQSQLTSDDAHYEVLGLSGDEQPCDIECYETDLAPHNCLSLKEFFQVMESDAIPSRVCIKVHSPARFSGRGVRTITSGYAALCTWLYAFEFIADENALSDNQWRRVLLALTDMLDDDCVDAHEALARCEAMEAEGKIQAGDPLRICAWLSRLSGINAGPYMRRIMETEANYQSLEMAVEVEILSEFNPARADNSFLSPENMTPYEWLNLRAERGEMLKRLHVNKLPGEYWKLMEQVPVRRKLLYSSLCTEDERAFCRRYLIDEYHVPTYQLKRRADLRRMYPEFLEGMQSD